MHKASSGIEEVSYCFYRSSVQFQGHSSWKIDLDMIWKRIQGLSQLWYTSYLLCFVSVVSFLWFFSYYHFVYKKYFRVSSQNSAISRLSSNWGLVMQMCFMDSDNIKEKKATTCSQICDKILQRWVWYLQNFDLCYFWCNSFKVVGVLENGIYCFLFIMFLFFKSCTTRPNFSAHGRNISK